ncbi:Forkhead-associated domain-containing protein 1 [Chelonia mydas]|uniref:Forkhead-associated domain-containing protein 1 n=1 Tax=Chelonia mydas TaxID=8469 RepID=M7AZL5_CHEMY|nr:Forkhead-associated domain-containing protein 1 [Chelonia mydas]
MDRVDSESVGIEDHHAVIEFSDSESSFVLQDFNSLHGTFVNDCHIQNAAVKVGAGDILRFGSGGTSYELVIENTSQVLGVVLSSELGFQPAATALQLPSSEGSTITSSSAEDEIILKMKDEISRLLGFESESKHKDTVIANLRDEIAVMTKKMAQAARNDVEFTQKLLTFEQDIEAKTGEIKALKEQLCVHVNAHSDKEQGKSNTENRIHKTELLLYRALVIVFSELSAALVLYYAEDDILQISNLQRDSSQVLCHSLSERDLEIANLKKEGEKLRRNQALTTGLVTSLQRDISAKEQRILQLKLNADKLKKENREKDNQLAVISAKRIGELELQVKGLQGEMQKNCTEQEIITSRLAEKTKAEEELKKECERKCLQLQEMGRREGLIKADLEQAKAQLECFKKQMIEIFYSQEAEIPETVTDQQLMEKISQITNENLQNHEEEKLLQEEMSSKDSEEKEVSESVEMLKKSLDEFQAQLDKLQESQNSLLHEKLNELKVEHEKELQDKIKLILLEKEEENKKVIELKMKEEEIVNAKLIEAVDSLEEARKREDENELLKQKIQKEIMEYKEQIKQHSETIVALEDRLLEATQHQKNIEEENLALREKIESRGELAAARKEILSKQAIILGLKKDLSEAKARMSDMIGELSEKQKMELERNLILVRSQESELNVLREKLFEMSDLVDKKDKDLRTSAEELRHAKEKLKKLKNAAKEKESEFEKLPQTDVQASNTTKDENLDLADVGAKCKGLRHEEIIQRQKDALTELRDRIKTLEKTQSLTVKEKVPEPLIVLKKDLSEKIAQKIGLEKERVPSSIKKMEAKLPSHFPNTYSNVALERTAKLEMSDALDLSEKMYLNLIHALGSLMNVKELTGVQSVKHLSQDEREKVRMQRQKDLELLYDKISKLKSRLERKEELLKEYESDIGQLRANKVSLQAYQAEMTKLEDDVYREAEENALLKEALERTQFQLNQEKRLNRAVKLHKVTV